METTRSTRLHLINDYRASHAQVSKLQVMGALLPKLPWGPRYPVAEVSIIIGDETTYPRQTGDHGTRAT